MKTRDILRDGVIYAGSNGLLGLANIATVLVAARYLSEGELGAVEMILALAMLVRLVIPLEVSQSTGIFCADAKTLEEKARYASTALWFSCCVYGIFVLAALGGAGLWSRLLFGDTDLRTLLVVGVLGAVAAGLFYHLQSQLRWNLQSGTYALVTVGYAGLFFGLTWLGCLRPSIRLYSIPGSMALVGGSAAVLAWMLCRHVHPGRFSLPALREMLVFSLPLVPSSLAIFLLEYFDRLAIRSVLSLDQVGVYAVASRLAMVVHFAIIGFQGALTPHVFRSYREAGTPDAIARVFRLFCALGIPLVATLAMFVPELLRVVARPEYSAAWGAVPFLAVAVIVSRLYIFAPGLVLERRTRTIAWVNLTAAVLNGVLNVALLLVFPHIVSAAAATAVSATVGAVLYLRASQRCYAIAYRWRTPLGCLAVATVTTVVGLAAGTRLGTGPAVGLKLLLCAGTAAAVGRISIRPEEIRQAAAAVRGFLFPRD